MDKTEATSWIHAVIAAVACAAAVQTPALAAPMKIEALMATKAESRLELADGSKRYMVAIQREGKAAGSGPLAGATVLEWGAHDVDPATGANSNGYLVFTAADGDIAYLQYRFRAVAVPGPEGKPRFVINGVWETVGGTGKFKPLRGAGSLRVQAPSPKERLWLLDGEVTMSE